MDYIYYYFLNLICSTSCLRSHGMNLYVYAYLCKTHQGKICNVLQCVMNGTCLCQRNDRGFCSFTVQPYLPIFILHYYWHPLAICKILTVLNIQTRRRVKYGTSILKTKSMKNVMSYTLCVYNHYNVLTFEECVLLHLSIYQNESLPEVNSRVLSFL